MYTRYLSAILFVAIVLPFTTSSTAQNFSQPHIAVYGTATTEIAPDTMVWRVGVRTNGKVIAEVGAQHDTNVAAVLEFLDHEEIKKEMIQTSQLQLAEDFEYRGGNRTKKGYFASSSISFESGTMEAYRSLWMGLSKLNAVSINGVSFDSSKRIELQESTRIRALSVASTKAETMAKVLESKIGKPLLIQEDTATIDDRRQLLTSNRMARVASDSASQGPSLSVGTIPIQVRVKVIFELLN